VGGLLYLGFRTDALLGWQWAEALGLEAAGRALRAWLAPLSVPDVVRFVLPDALWVYALTFVLARLHRGASRTERSAWLSIALLAGPGAELGQQLDLVPGTFDPVDLLATTAAFALALALEARRRSPDVPVTRRAAT
jgi:hypothetical protein